MPQRAWRRSGALAQSLGERAPIGQKLQVEFDPTNPFPLVEGSSHEHYAEAQRHSREVDEWLGLKVDEIETELIAQAPHRGKEPMQELWIGLGAQRLLTPYTEIRRILEDLELKQDTNSTIVDLGAAYGRMGFVMARHYPELRFIGYEYVKERVEAGAQTLARWKCENARLIEADLTSPDFRLPAEASIFFIYDFGSRQAIETVLEQLRQLAQSKPIRVVGRGRASRDAIEHAHPWLSQVRRPRHFAHFSIYSS